MIVRRTLVPMLAIALCAPLVVGCKHFGGGKVAGNAPAPKPAEVEIPVEQSEKFDDARGELKNPSRFFLTHAKLLEGAGKIDEARKSYAVALREDPRSKDALLGLARMDQLAGREAEAEERYRQLALGHPNDPLVLDAIGQFYSEQQRWPEAVRSLDLAVQNAPRDETIRYHLAVATARSGNVEAARPHFHQTVGVAETHYNIGYILYEAGRLPDAEREFIAAIAAKPELEQAQQLLGEVRAKLDPGTIYADRGEQPVIGGSGSGNVQPASRQDFADAPRTRVAPVSNEPTRSASDPRFQRPRQPAPSPEFDSVPAWNPSGEWGASPQFEQPVRGDGNSNLTPAQREQMRNQQ